MRLFQEWQRASPVGGGACGVQRSAWHTGPWDTLPVPCLWCHLPAF